MKYDRPIPTNLQELHSDLLGDKKGIVFVPVPGRVGIRGNSAADTAADDALDGDISDELIPFSDLKPRMSKYIMQLWQHEWDQWLDNKFPQWGAADAEIKVPSGENTELKRPPFQAWSRSVYSHTCYAYCQGFLPCLFLPFQSIHLHFFQNLSRFFSCVGRG